MSRSELVLMMSLWETYFLFNWITISFRVNRNGQCLWIMWRETRARTTQTRARWSACSCQHHRFLIRFLVGLKKKTQTNKKHAEMFLQLECSYSAFLPTVYLALFPPSRFSHPKALDGKAPLITKCVSGWANYTSCRDETYTVLISRLNIIRKWSGASTR